MARKKSFAVLGLNNIGFYIAKLLSQKNQSVTVFDINEEKINNIIGQIEVAEGIIADTTNKQILEKNGISQFDGVIVAFQSAIETSIVTTLNLIDLDIESMIIIAGDEKHKRILKALGIPEKDIVTPSLITGELVATKSIFDIEAEVQSTDGEFISTKIVVLEPSAFEKSISELNLNPNKDFNIVQIKRNGKTIMPEPTVTLKEKDVLTVFAKSSLINDLIFKISGKNEG